MSRVSKLALVFTTALIMCPVSPAVADNSAPVDGTTGTPLGGFGAGAVKFDAKAGTFAATTRPPADQTDYTGRGRIERQDRPG